MFPFKFCTRVSGRKARGRPQSHHDEISTGNEEGDFKKLQAG